mmetsp:Transcript_83745/g.200919  ORF Transcript_83745/g.200919 Transcript_83745/m.200919 type:complete len:172 (-) Transcript_83745:4-519(-)
MTPGSDLSTSARLQPMAAASLGRLFRSPWAEKSDGASSEVFSSISPPNAAQSAQLVKGLRLADRTLQAPHFFKTGWSAGQRFVEKDDARERSIHKREIAADGGRKFGEALQESMGGKVRWCELGGLQQHLATQCSAKRAAGEGPAFGRPDFAGASFLQDRMECRAEICRKG